MTTADCYMAEYRSRYGHPSPWLCALKSFRVMPPPRQIRERAPRRDIVAETMRFIQDAAAGKSGADAEAAVRHALGKAELDLEKEMKGREAACDRYWKLVGRWQIAFFAAAVLAQAVFVGLVLLWLRGSVGP